VAVDFTRLERFEHFERFEQRSAMLNALTVDVEDYYHVSAFESVVPFECWNQYESRVVRNTERILDIFDEYKARATFFVLGHVAERHAALVRTIQVRGHEIGSHGYSHRRIYTQTPERFREETRTAKRILEDIIGEPVHGYRAASYSITLESLWALDILVEEGFRYDSSIFPVRHDLYGIPGHKRFFCLLNGNGSGAIAEIPLSTIRLMGVNLPVAGGGYLRVLPYAMTKFALLNINRYEQQPAVVYFHPWEIDPDQPRIYGGYRSRFRHYTNLRGMEKKVRRLLSSFNFASIRDVYAAHLNLWTNNFRSYPVKTCLLSSL
jgi:polysaccharide deacetylase family protein (PEP-CTERM system associated)